jgi:hypothetical protein
MDLYVMGFAIALAGLLSFSIPGSWLATVVAAYRIADIVTYRMFFLLVKSEERPWKSEMLRRSLIVVMVNFCETILGFAILYRNIGHIAANGNLVSLSRVSALYFSAVTATTLGYGDFTPADGPSRVLVMTQLSSTIVFLIFIIPALVSLFSVEAGE